MRTALAHAVSIAGHPAILMPLAAGFAASAGGASPEMTRTILWVTSGVVVAVLIYSLVQVRRGQWADTDASRPEERSQLNLFLAPLLAAGAGWAWWSGQPLALALGLGASAAIIAAALVSSRWMKLSLHTAFAVFAASLFWPDVRVVGAGLVLAGLIAWARLHLKRHTAADVAAGALAGAAAGSVVQILIAAP
ncbi:MAG: hypothetical protein ACK4P2_03920 [Hyphomonas sp.]